MLFMVPGLVRFFFLHIILNRMTRVFKFSSRYQHLIQSQLGFSENLKAPVGKKTHDFVQFTTKIRQPSFSGKGKTDEYDASLLGEEAELVMEKLGISCQGDQGLQERLSPADLYNLFEENEPRSDEVQGAFDVFDENKDGFIDARELQRVLCALGLKQGSEMENCTRMIGMYDENGDGKIDFHEFVKFMETSSC